MADRPSTPPPRSGPPLVPMTPEQVRRMEESRLRAKALRSQRDAATRTTNATSNPITSSSTATTTTATPPNLKRVHSAISTSNITPNSRDARRDAPNGTSATGGPPRPHDDITTARKFAKFVDYDFSKMTDTKGGFMTAEDDPHNKALQAPASDAPGEAKPAHMSVREWERLQTMRKLANQRQGPYEPGLSVLNTDEEKKICEECGSLELDFEWLKHFGVRVCKSCRESLPDKYSLLTKTEAREDYLLTEPELKDRELLPTWDKPNPHKSTWHDMSLFLRCQVEAYAFSDRKWGSPEALDAEFVKRQKVKVERKEAKWEKKLKDLKKKTRVEAYKRGRTGANGGEFGDKMALRAGERHEHEWGRAILNGDGIGVKTCVECGMKVEELEF